MSVASLANIFSHSVGCLFVLLMVSFAVEKLLSLIRSPLFLFLFSLLYEVETHVYAACIFMYGIYVYVVCICMCGVYMHAWYVNVYICVVYIYIY